MSDCGITEFDNLPPDVQEMLARGETVEINGQKYKAEMYLEEEIIRADGTVEKLKGEFNGLTRNR